MTPVSVRWFYKVEACIIIHMSLYVLSHITAWTQGRPLLPTLRSSSRFSTILLSHNCSYLHKLHTWVPLPPPPLCFVLFICAFNYKNQKVIIGFWHLFLRIYVTRSRGMSHMSDIFNFDFQYKSLVHLRCYILIQTPFLLDIWLRRSKHSPKFKNNVKHLFKPVTQNQYSQHLAHSPWSCHICKNEFSDYCQNMNPFPR